MISESIARKKKALETLYGIGNVEVLLGKYFVVRKEIGWVVVGGGEIVFNRDTNFKEVSENMVVSIEGGRHVRLLGENLRLIDDFGYPLTADCNIYDVERVADLLCFTYRRLGIPEPILYISKINGKELTQFLRIFKVGEWEVENGVHSVDVRYGNLVKSSGFEPTGVCKLKVSGDKILEYGRCAVTGSDKAIGIICETKFEVQDQGSVEFKDIQVGNKVFKVRADKVKRFPWLGGSIAVVNLSNKGFRYKSIISEKYEGLIKLNTDVFDITPLNGYLLWLKEFSFCGYSKYLIEPSGNSVLPDELMEVEEYKAKDGWFGVKADKENGPAYLTIDNTAVGVIVLKSMKPKTSELILVRSMNYVDIYLYRNNPFKKGTNEHEHFEFMREAQGKR